MVFLHIIPRFEEDSRFKVIKVETNNWTIFPRILQSHPASQHSNSNPIKLGSISASLPTTLNNGVATLFTTMKWFTDQTLAARAVSSLPNLSKAQRSLLVIRLFGELNFKSFRSYLAFWRVVVSSLDKKDRNLRIGHWGEWKTDKTRSNATNNLRATFDFW